MTRAEARKLPHGLYRLYWKDGGANSGPLRKVRASDLTLTATFGSNSSDFGTTEVDVPPGGVYTNATPSFHNRKVGVNFKF